MGQVAPSETLATVGTYVSLDALRVALENIEWAPLRLASGRRERPASPRLPHALLLHLAQHARELACTPTGALPTVAPVVIPDLARLETLVGADPTVVANALAGLTQVGVLEGAGQGATPASGVRLAPTVLGPEPRCAGLDWRAVATATAGSPSAWMAAHALAERLDPYDWMPVARSGLEQALGCGVSGVRGALERLISAEVLKRREQRGGVSVYQFTDRAWGRGNGGAVVPPPARPARPGDTERRVVAPERVPHAPAFSAEVEPAAAAFAEPGVRLVIGGVELEIPAGCRAHVLIGPDGRPTITLAGPGPGR